MTCTPPKLPSFRPIDGAASWIRPLGDIRNTDVSLSDVQSIVACLSSTHHCLVSSREYGGSLSNGCLVRGVKF
jgi:hypothetical protein